MEICQFWWDRDKKFKSEFIRYDYIVMREREREREIINPLRVAVVLQ